MPVGIQCDIDCRTTMADVEAAKVILVGTLPSDNYTNAYIDLDVVRRLGETDGAGRP